MDLSNVINISPYSLNKKDKKQLLNSFLIDLAKHHYRKNKNFKRMMDAYGYNDKDLYDYINLPFLPVRLFKMFDLKSIDQDNIVKTMTSSGTSGQSVSKIFLYKETATNQTKV